MPFLFKICASGDTDFAAQAFAKCKINSVCSCADLLKVHSFLDYVDSGGINLNLYEYEDR